MACFCCGGSPPVGPSNAPIPAVGMAVGLELHTIPIANKPAAPARLPNTSDPAIAASAVMVVVRIRPSNTREQANKSTSVVIPSGPASLTLSEDPTGKSKAVATDRQFSFDAVLPEAASQSEAFRFIGAPMLTQFVAGFNACIFAYGQTGSGKTYTMEGGTAAEARGIMPRLALQLFEGLKARKGLSHTVDATYIEIYQEALNDLLTPVASAVSPLGGALSPASTAALEPTIRQTPAGTIVLEGATRRAVHSASDIQAILEDGTTRRTRGETAMNAVSSRSHAVLTLTLTSRQDGDEDGTTATTCKLNLIDLAGSERSDAAQTTGTRLKEGAKINQSLSALGNVINALTGGPGRTHIPYRDSKLTRLLQDSLGANAYCLMALCVSPASMNYDETLSALRFAERVKTVQNAPKLAVDPVAEKMARLLADNAALRTRVTQLEAFCNEHGLHRQLFAAGLGLEEGRTDPVGSTSAPAGGSHGCCIIM